MPSTAFRSRVNPRSAKRERLTVSSSAVSFAATGYTLAQTERKEARLADSAILQVLTDEIYWTIDGSTPSSTVGFRSQPYDYIYLETQQQVQTFKTIRVTADAAIEALFLYA